MTQPLNVVFAGTPEFAVPCLKALYNGPDSVLAVLTNPDKPSGRGKILKAPPVKEEALRHGTEVHQPTSVRTRAFRAWLRALKPDLLVVVAYGKILPKSVLEIPRLGCINVHASLLPKLRGAAPIQWSIVRGEDETGVSIMQMDEGMDTGDVMFMDRLAIEPEDTAGSLHDKLSTLGAESLSKAMGRLRSGEATFQAQDHDHATYAPILQKADGCIRWDDSAKEIDRVVRGFSPWPSAYTYVDVRGKQKQLRIYRVKTVELSPEEIKSSQPGQVVRVARPDEVVIRAGDAHGVSILECQLQGRKRMHIKDFMCGFNWSTGDLLKGL